MKVAGLVSLTLRSLGQFLRCKQSSMGKQYSFVLLQNKALDPALPWSTSLVRKVGTETNPNLTLKLWGGCIPDPMPMNILSLL